MILKNSCLSLRHCKVVNDDKKYLSFGRQGAFLYPDITLIQTADTYYMEERMLQGMVISNLKMKRGI